ncbi:MAG: GNAT family N-acetyltransferase [Solirubrobacteraceae bacterium]
MTVRWSDQITGAELAHPFADEAWMRAWWDAFGAGALQVGVLEREDGSAAALPMTSRRGRLSALANYHSPIFEPAAVEGAAAEELLRAAFARPEPEVLLHALPSVALPLVRLAAAGRRLLVEEGHTSPIVQTVGALDAYTAGLGSTLKRRRRKLEREHEVSLRLDDGGVNLDDALARGFEIEASGWKTRAGTAILSAPHTRAFYSAIAHAYSERGELVLGTLCVDGREIAWHLTLRRGPRLYMLKTGYLEQSGKLAPGLLLHLLTIESCFADPSIEAYELLGAADRWKLDFANSKRRHVRAFAFTRGPSGTGRWSLRRHGVPLARRARARLRELRS